MSCWRRGGEMGWSAVAGEIEEAGGTTETLALDIANVERAAEALAALGPVDILVNNAGGNRPASLLDVTVEDFDAVMGINVRGAYFCAQAVAREMVAAKRGGVIINTSSQMGHVGGPRRHGLLRQQARHRGHDQGDGHGFGPI